MITTSRKLRQASLALVLVCAVAWPAHGAHMRSREASDEAELVVGRFRAPAPERVHRQRLAKGTDFGHHTLAASYRVAEQSEMPEKTVHGVMGASSERRKQAAANQRQVGAKMQVTDEGLNYPASKLSADIYGNLAEIVTAPPEAVEQDFLLPVANSYLQFGSRRSN